VASDDEDDDADAVVMCPDTHGVIHLVLLNGSWRRSICSAWGRSMAHNTLLWSAPGPFAFPTCVFCVFYVFYTEHERRQSAATS